MKILKGFFDKFNPKIKIVTNEILANPYKEKRIKQRGIIKGDPAWWSYFSEVVQSGEASALCGLPKRDYTEVIDDPKTGDRIIRYIESNHE